MRAALRSLPNLAAGGNQMTTTMRSNNTVAAEQLGRCGNVAQVVARYGEDAVRPVIDGDLTADDLALSVLEDFASMPGASGRKMFQAALDDGIESVENPPDLPMSLAFRTPGTSTCLT